ncbi:MAG: cell division protein ZipA C-terminal FtsZ-binding domain-containing protein [Methylococcaceae bacterium]|nr:cell division protein ZipA C-terminal FtsZ-binding domain-containing protein [Methylococcaceae bacterium]
MDKDLLRMVIIAIGIIAIIGMVLWSAYNNKRARRDIDFYDKGNPLDNIDKSLIVNTVNDDFDIVSLGSALDEDLAPDPITVASESIQSPEAKTQVNNFEVPKIIQFSIVAVADEGFNGRDLDDAFQQVGLEYGSMKIYERLDEQRRVDFAVASMVEPGTFPETNRESFNSPGIVFFLQPGELENPLEIFDEFIQTINFLSVNLDGIKWDHNRQPLSEETIQALRMQISTF